MLCTTLSRETLTPIRTHALENPYPEKGTDIDLPFIRRMESLRSTLQETPEKKQKIINLLIEKYNLHDTLIHNETRTLFTEGALTIVNCVLPDDLDHLLNLLQSGWNTEAASHAKARYEEDIECKFKGVLLADGRQHFSESFLLQHPGLTHEYSHLHLAINLSQVLFPPDYRYSR